jgi:hypothetical protein
MQGNTASQFASGSRQQQPSLRRGVIARQSGQLLVKTLEAQVEAERRGILLK